MAFDAADFLAGLFGSTTLISPNALPDDLRDAYEERAAIMEYDGGLPRERAEAAALAETIPWIGAECARPTRPPGRDARG